MTHLPYRPFIALCAVILAMACGDPDPPLAPVPDAGDPQPDTGPTTDSDPDPEPEMVDPEPVPTEDATISLGAFSVSLRAAEGAFTIEDSQGRVLLESLSASELGPDPDEDRLGAYAPLAYRHTALEVENLTGAFRFTREGGAWVQYTTITAIEEGEGGQRRVTWDAQGAPPAIMVLSLDDRENLSVSWTIPTPARGDAQPLIAMAFECGEEERFYGLGSQSYAAEHRGWRVPIWTREQGVGKKDDGIFPLNGALEDAYAPMAWLMSSRGAGMLLGRAEHSVFELCSERDDAWRLETFADTLSFTLLSGETPKDLITGLTAYTGRIEPPTPWTFAPWNDGLKSAERVRGTAALLRDNGVPASVMWVEDWIGGEETVPIGYHLTYTWIADTERWPDLEGLIGDLNDDGFEFLAYFNPFVRKNTVLWEEGLEGDFLIKTPEGATYEFIDPIFKPASMVDLTNPDARAWLREHQMRAVALGVRGWMADFAEWLPFDAVMHDGRRGAEVHNLYPLMWQEANRANLDEAFPDGDYTFFARSGFAWTEGGTSGLAPVVWAGDQNTTWDEGDGIKTVIPIGLNLGMSGVAVFAHDIAGYASALNPNTTRELFFRWTSLGAFSPVMRTHHGAEDEQNWNLARDEETLAHWKRYAIEHTRLYPYLMALAIEASNTGIPMFRHLILEFPDDPEAPGTRAQFMLGDALMVAPVLDEGASEVEVYLPEGRWVDWWTGAALEGPGRHRVEAPLTEIPVFARSGAIVPRFAQTPDTLTRHNREGLIGLDELEDRLEVRLYGSAPGSAALYDGLTTISQSGEAFSEPLGAISVDGEALPLCSEVDERGCVDLEAREVRIDGAGFEVSVEGGPIIAVEGPARQYDLRLY